MKVTKTTHYDFEVDLVGDEAGEEYQWETDMPGEYGGKKIDAKEIEEQMTSEQAMKSTLHLEYRAPAKPASRGDIFAFVSICVFLVGLFVMIAFGSVVFVVVMIPRPYQWPVGALVAISEVGLLGFAISTMIDMNPWKRRP